MIAVDSMEDLLLSEESRRDAKMRLKSCRFNLGENRLVRVSEKHQQG
jgi:hypothetical protein